MTLKTILLHASGIGMLAAAPCAAQGDTISQVMKQTAHAPFVLVGEMHGTREVPALVAGLAKGWAASGVAPAVVVALEYPQSESAQLQAYADSDGGAAARKRLLATPFWTREAQDGRSSAAMLALVESVRLQARAGQTVRLAAFDQNALQAQSGASRDKDMADNLRAIVAANRSARIIALTGNYHARQQGGAPWNANYQFMGSYLKDLAPYSLKVDGSSGSYWGCSGPKPADCKITNFGRDADSSARIGLYVDSELAAHGYQQALMLERISASLPANRAQ